DVLLAARLDSGQGQFLAKYRCELFERELDFENMPSRLAAGAVAIARPRWPQGRAYIAFALSDSSRSAAAEAELGNLNLGQWDADEVLPLLADHFPAADVFAQVALHLAADKLAKTLVIAFDSLSHSCLSTGSESRVGVDSGC